jgi:hypothetical protein
VLAGGALQPGAGDHGLFALALPRQANRRHQRRSGAPRRRSRLPATASCSWVQHEQAAPFGVEQRRERQEKQTTQVAVASLIPLAAQFLTALGGLPETK